MDKKEAIYILSDELSDIKETLDKAKIISGYLYQDYFSKNDDKVINSVFLHEHARIIFDIVSDYTFEARKVIEKLFEEQKNSPAADQSK